MSPAAHSANLPACFVLVRESLPQRFASEDYGNRTLGRSCIYGSDGGVIYASRGADCRR
jgi:hypothetical protein